MVKLKEKRPKSATVRLDDKEWERMLRLQKHTGSKSLSHVLRYALVELERTLLPDES